MKTDDDLREMEGMLVGGTWPDGNRRRALTGQDPDSREHQAAGQTKPEDCLHEVEGEDWQAHNLSTSLSKALARSCRLGYSNAEAVYVQMWRDVQPMLISGQSHLFWERFSHGKKHLKTSTVCSALEVWCLLECQLGHALLEAILR